MTEGMNAVSSVARSRGVQPVAYLQNFRTAAPPYVFHHANVEQLRWYASMFFAFGGQHFANFVSHDDHTIAGVPHQGMLTARNGISDLAVSALRTLDYTRQLQTHLAGQTYYRFVAPFLSVPTGDLVGWLPSDQILAGEFGRRADGTAFVFFARRNVEQSAASIVSFNDWWTRVERLDLSSGQWVPVGYNTNQTQVSLAEFPGALYKLSMQ